MVLEVLLIDWVDGWDPVQKMENLAELALHLIEALPISSCATCCKVFTINSSSHAQSLKLSHGCVLHKQLEFTMHSYALIACDVFSRFYFHQPRLGQLLQAQCSSI